jgi:hypothetical protein
MIYTEQDCLVVKELQGGVNRKTLEHHNLQNSRPICHQISRQTELITYAIPCIINGRLLREKASKSANLKLSAHNKMDLITLKKPMAAAYIKHKIFKIGDSHVRGLSDKVSSDLDDTFSVTGISKPNADIDETTSLGKF